MPRGARNGSSAATAGESVVVVGGSGFVGAAISARAIEAGLSVTVVDRRRPHLPSEIVCWQEADVLVDEVRLPEGPVVLATGGGHPRPRWPWTLALETCLCTARLLTQLQGRRVTLLSSVEAYGYRPGLLTEDEEPLLPWPQDALEAWCRDALLLARDCCAPSRAAPLCRELADADPTGRWTYGLAKRAQELLLATAGIECELTVLRVANTFGTNQDRVVSRLVRRALAGRPLVVSDATRSFVPVEDVAKVVTAGLPSGLYNVGGDPIALPALADLVRSACGSSSPIVISERNGSDSSGLVDGSRLRAAGVQLTSLVDALEAFVETVSFKRPPLFAPPLPVVMPPRPTFPERVGDRQQACLWSGALKNGNQWSTELAARLAETLQLSAAQTLLVTRSGTEALRLAIVAAAPTRRPGDVAIVPSFTFPATTEVLRQLGYVLHYVDVEHDTWTIDPRAVGQALASTPVSLVVCVDTFGNPCDYDKLATICRHAEVPLVADSAAAIGSLYQGKPVSTQADAHAFSMSFAKVLSAGGAGGAVAIPGDRIGTVGDWTRSALIDELHAVAALDQLEILPELIERRALVASVYGDGIGDQPGLTAQRVRPGDRHSYVHWVMRVTAPQRRTALEHELNALGVETKRYFRALHLSDPSARCGPLSTTEHLHDGVLALPMSSEITPDDAESAVAALVEASLASSQTALASRI